MAVSTEEMKINEHIANVLPLQIELRLGDKTHQRPRAH